MVRHKRLKANAKFPRTRSSVSSERNLAEVDDYFRETLFLKRAARACKSPVAVGG